MEEVRNLSLQFRWQSFAVPSDYYIIALLSVSLLWLIFLWLSASNRRNQLERTEQIGSHHASNRWLKGKVKNTCCKLGVKEFYI